MPTNQLYTMQPPLKGPASKLGSQVLQRLEAEIIDAGWGQGRRLGAEEELSHRFGVSRAIMREAIAMAELNGLVESRRGNNGGLFVAASAQWVAVSTLRHFLVLSGATPAEVDEIRTIVQRCACLAAMRQMDSEHAQRLREHLRVRSENPRDTIRGLRLALGEIHSLSGEPMFGLFDQALAESSMDLLLWAGASRKDVERLGTAIWDLRRIQIEAVIGADPVSAWEAQEQVQRAYQREQRHAARHSYTAATLNVDVEQRSLAFMRDELKPMKKPEAVARIIAQKIIRSEIAVGDRIGCEQDLMRDLGVSRGVVREAVRTLERHGIVALERGFAGGIYAAAPTSEEAVRVARVYLSMEAPGEPSATLNLALALQLAAAEFAARRAKAGDAALSQRLEQFDTWLDASCWTPLEELRAYYFFLAEISGSRVLDCFMRILSNHATIRVDASKIDIRATRELQRGLLRAIAQGDRSLARRYVLEGHKASGVGSRLDPCAEGA